MVFSEGKLDPWQFITIAGLAHAFYKVFEMPENTIGVLGDSYQIK